MKFHKYDPETKVYIETVDADEQPENSVGGFLPEETKYYTLAYIEDTWVSVIRDEYEVTEDGFKLKNEVNALFEGPLKQ